MNIFHNSLVDYWDSVLWVFRLEQSPSVQPIQLLDNFLQTIRSDKQLLHQVSRACPYRSAEPASCLLLHFRKALRRRVLYSLGEDPLSRAALELWPSAGGRRLFSALHY